jgi:hypothetical protein
MYGVLHREGSESSTPPPPPYGVQGIGDDDEEEFR